MIMSSTQIACQFGLSIFYSFIYDARFRFMVSSFYLIFWFLFIQQKVVRHLKELIYIDYLILLIMVFGLWKPPTTFLKKFFLYQTGKGSCARSLYQMISCLLRCNLPKITEIEAFIVAKIRFYRKFMKDKKTDYLSRSFINVHRMSEYHKNFSTFLSLFAFFFVCVCVKMWLYFQRSTFNEKFNMIQFVP